MFTLCKADKDLFARCQTIYSDTDTEMWYDWHARLRDTDWTDNCYFLLSDGKRVGGAILEDDFAVYPFLVPPAADRGAFWAALLKCAETPINTVFAATDEDANILQTLGFVPKKTKMVMCRPAEPIDAVLPAGFVCHAVDPKRDAELLAALLHAGFTGSIAAEDGDYATMDAAMETVRNCLAAYDQQNFLYYITNDAGNPVAVAIAGVAGVVALGYAEICELCVLPEYREKGLGRYLLDRVTSEANGKAPFVKLCARAGNPAIRLYQRAGFHAGPRFTDMERYTEKKA